MHCYLSACSWLDLHQFRRYRLNHFSLSFQKYPRTFKEFLPPPQPVSFTLLVSQCNSLFAPSESSSASSFSVFSSSLMGQLIFLFQKSIAQRVVGKKPKGNSSSSSGSIKQSLVLAVFYIKRTNTIPLTGAVG